MEKSGGKRKGKRMARTGGEVIYYGKLKPESTGLNNKKPQKGLNAYSLTGIGIGGIIGAGFFLGSTSAV